MLKFMFTIHEQQFNFGNLYKHKHLEGKKTVMSKNHHNSL